MGFEPVVTDLEQDLGVPQLHVNINLMFSSSEWNYVELWEKKQKAEQTSCHCTHTWQSMCKFVLPISKKKRCNRIGNDSEKTHKVDQRHGMTLTEEVTD